MPTKERDTPGLLRPVFRTFMPHSFRLGTRKTPIVNYPYDQIDPIRTTGARLAAFSPLRLKTELSANLCFQIAQTANLCFQSAQNLKKPSGALLLSLIALLACYLAARRAD